ncbi:MULTISPECIES: hypothetical protein [Streptomyces]|uniref:Uncharacterized protein n=2 Tax=Streptomyces TaxID=1883 RepID=A0ABU4K9H4_9ACTN|nr:hypothetical protein [Streptomyces roseolus]MDX2294418.1 hypothetical protein [Streptomyces roseolus]
MELPLEAYMTSYSDQVTIDTALRTLQTQCMAEYGLTVDLPRPGVNPPAYNNTISIERRYGIADRKQAEKYGYGLPKELTRSAERFDTELSGVEVEVLTGRAKTDFRPPEGTKGDGAYLGGGQAKPARTEHQGKRLHEGGCTGWSKRQIKWDESDAGLISQLASKSLSDARSNEPVKKAIKDWSACMKKQGRSATDPYRAMEQGYASGDGTTKDAIELALDDIDCKQQTQLIEVWFKAESEIQKRLIEENKDRLVVVKTRMSEVLAAAKAVN